MNAGTQTASPRRLAAASLGLWMCLGAGCTKPEPEPAAWEKATTPAERARAAGPDARDQYALLDAIVEAKGDKL